jgi:HAD superfamily hydrolase (TIGR01509 family)
MLVKAILFDVDGTLVDSVDQHARAWQDVFREFRRDIPYDAIRAQIGKGGDQLMPVFLDEATLRDRGAAIEHRRTEIFRDRYLPTIQPLPGAKALLREVDKRGLRAVLASSAKGEELAALKRIIGIEPRDIEGETSSDDAEHSKPEPDIFKAALAKLTGVSAEEAIVVGDTPYDAEAAGKAGLRSIGLLSGGFAEEALRGAGCLAVYRDPAHLAEEIESSPLGNGEPTS